MFFIRIPYCDDSFSILFYSQVMPVNDPPRAVFPAPGDPEKNFPKIDEDQQELGFTVGELAGN